MLKTETEKTAPSPYKVKAAADANAAVNGLKERFARHSALQDEANAKQAELAAAQFEIRSFMGSVPESANPALRAAFAQQNEALKAMGGGIDWSDFMQKSIYAAVMLREGL